MLLTYNNKIVHSATKQTPNEARKKDKEFKSKLNASIEAISKSLEEKGITEKERTSHFKEKKKKNTVKKMSTKMGQKYYDLEGFGRPLMRHELLKV